MPGVRAAIVPKAGDYGWFSRSDSRCRRFRFALGWSRFVGGRGDVLDGFVILFVFKRLDNQGRQTCRQCPVLAAFK